jgi:hypothetical protein
MGITNEDVVINGTMIRYKFNEIDSMVEGTAKAIYFYKGDYYLVSIMIEDINPPMKIYAHWADDLADTIM